MSDSTSTTRRMTPGDDMHLTLLMTPHGLNFVTGQDRQHLLAFGRAAFEAGKAAAEQKDSQIVDFMAENYLGPDFRWGEPATEVVVIEMPRKQSYCGDFRADMETAMAKAKEHTA